MVPTRGLEPPIHSLQGSCLTIGLHRQVVALCGNLAIYSTEYSAHTLYGNLIFGTPPRIRTETVRILSAMPAASWASGAFMVGREGIEPPQLDFQSSTLPTELSTHGVSSEI